MTCRLFMLASSALLLSAASLVPAHAFTPVMPTPEECWANAELVARMRVESVTLLQAAATAQDSPEYASRLRVLEVEKGDAEPGDVVEIHWPGPLAELDDGLDESGVVAPWLVSIYSPGMEGLFYVGPRNDGKGLISQLLCDDVEVWANRELLPTRVGQTLELRR